MTVFRQYLLKLARTNPFERFVASLEASPDRHVNLLRVLTYHRVDELNATPHLYPEMISATPSQFARQMEHLADRYHVVDLKQVVEAVRGLQVLPPRSVLITFDDAYRDFKQHAWPVLQSHNLPAVLFVPTAFPDQPGKAFWWDRLYEAVGHPKRLAESTHFRSYRELLSHVKTLPDDDAQSYVDQLCRHQGCVEQKSPVLGWDELRCLSRGGLVLAPHTRTHPLMNRIPIEEAVDQALLSREDLQRETGNAPPVLAYPAGAYSDQLAARLQERGFDLAFTTSRGTNDLRVANPMKLRRCNIRHSTPDAIVRIQLLSATRHFNRLWPLRSAV